jgi:putative aldouronate transport system substrate-binding protein
VENNKQKRLLKQAAPVLASMMVFSLVATACSTTSSQTGSQTSSPNKTSAPTNIKIFIDYSMPQPPSADSQVQKEYEKKTNVKLDMTWIPAPDYTKRLNVALAAGDIADIIKINSVTNTVFRQMVQQGAFWDLTPYIKDYPNFAAIDQTVWESTKINQKTYAIPSGRPTDGGTFPLIRQDWLDKLGLKMPATMDDLYNVMKAFKNNKPDGRSDTVGYTMRQPFFLQDVFTQTNGTWKVIDNKLVEMNFRPEMIESLEYQRKLYDEGLIPRDFPVLKENQFWDIATNGSSGINVATPEGHFRYTEEQVKANPKVNWAPIPALSAKAGAKPFVSKAVGYNGLLAIPKKSVSEEKLKAILSFINYGSGGEGLDLTLYGIKDVDYTIVDGFKIATAAAANNSVGTGSWGKIFSTVVDDLWQYAAGMPKDVYERNMKIAKEKAKISVPDPSAGLVSETDLKLGSDYKKKISDMKTQVIIGKASMKDWEKFIEELKNDANYQKIITEMNAAYQERIAKK